MLSDEHLFSLFMGVDLAMGGGGELSPGALGGAKPGAALPGRAGEPSQAAARPAPSWDEPGDAGASASDGGASGDPELDELEGDDSEDDSGPPRARGGRERGRGARGGRGHGCTAADSKARGRGRVRARARDLEVRRGAAAMPSLCCLCMLGVMYAMLYTNSGQVDQSP